MVELPPLQPQQSPPERQPGWQPPQRTSPQGYPPPRNGYPPRQPRHAPPPRRRWPWVVGGVFLLLVIIGIVNGGNRSAPITAGNVPELTTTEATAPTLESEAPIATPEPTSIRTPRPTAKPKPTPKSTPVGPLTTFGPGTYVVGTDILPGTYRSAGPTSDLFCYWARLKDTSGDMSAIVANDNTSGPTTVTISPSDGAFTTSRCQEWHKIG